MTKERFFRAFALFAFLFAAAGPAHAQGTTSRVTGVVTDSVGAAVSGATVTLRNEGTNSSLTTETSDSGVYTFDLIQPGNYEVTVEKQGFKRVVSSRNAVLINQPATVNVQLEVGEVSATVSVTGTAEQVQTSTSGNVGSTIEQRTLEALPIVGTRGRNPLSLINYQPGVVSGAWTGGGIHVNGSRDRAFNYTLDGIDVNETSAGGSNFAPLRTNPDSLQEFQIVTSNFTAELGRSSGAQVTLITKSGGNRFTGNLFEFYRTPRFNANEYSNNFFGRPKNQFVQHIFGGSVGGPIIKDKFFFFTNLQLLRAYDTLLVTRPVYTQTARSGIYRYVQGGQNAPTGTATPSVDGAGNPRFAPCSAAVTTGCINTYNVAANPSGIGVDPALAAIINSMPLPNNFASGDGLNVAGFSFGAPQRERQYDFTSKFDYKLNDNNSLYVRYSQGEQNTIGDSANGGRRIFPDSPDLVNTYRDPKNLAINYRFSPTGNLTNEFVFGINKFAFQFQNPTPNANFPFSFNNVSTPERNFTYNARRLRTLQFVDNVTWIRGSHAFKGGLNFRFGRQIDDRTGVAGTTTEPLVSFNPPTTTFGAFGLPTTGINATDLTRLRNTINDLLGRVGTYSQAFVADPSGNQFAAPGTRWDFNASYPEYDFYFQDTWRARSNLVLDLGLRWELKLAPTSKGRPILAPNQPVTAGAPPTNTIRFVEADVFQNDLNNLSPSVGFAWDPLKDGKTSIRANYRLAYDRFPTQLFAENIFQNAPGNTFGSTNTAFGQAGGLLRNIGTVSLAPTSTPDVLRQPAAFGTGTTTVVDPALKFPEIHQWFFGVQREVFANTVLELNYIGRRANNLLGGYDANQVNLSAVNSRCPGETFLTAFQAAQNPANTSICLINYLINGTNTAANTATFRSQFSTQLAQNSVAGAALTLAQRTGTQSLTANGFDPFFFQKFPQFAGSLVVIDSNDISRYHAFQAILKRRFRNGVSFQFGYTLAKSMDTRSFDPNFTTVGRANAQTASSTPFDINNRMLNYALSDFDRRHSLQGTYVYELPFGRGRRYGSGISRFLDYVAGGWQVAGNLVWASGRPFTVYSGVTSFGSVVQSTADCNGCSRNMGSVVQEVGTNYFFTAAQRAMFSRPAVGSNGNTGRNFFIGPRFFQTDLGISKKFRITERFNFDLRLDATNVTNTPSFDAPTATLTSASFGLIGSGAISDARRIQVALKLNF